MQWRKTYVYLFSWTRKHPYVAAWLVGCLYYALVISWMFGVKTGELARGAALKVIVAMSCSLLIASFALGFVIFLYLWRRLGLTLTNPKAWWLGTACWLVSDYIRALFVSFILLGPGGRIGPYWTFGNFGYWLVKTPLVYSSRLGGLYFLEGFVVALVFTLVAAIRTRRYWPLIAVLLVMTISSVLGQLIWRNPQGQKIDVTAVQFGEHYDESEYSQQTSRLLSSQPPDSADVLVLPEYSHLWEQQALTDTASVGRVLKRHGLAIDSQREKYPTSGLGHNLITYHRADGSVLHATPKWFLIPGGEYIPYVHQLILAYAGQDKIIQHFNEQKTVDPAASPEDVFTHDGISFGSHACSAVIAPELYRQSVHGGATILTNSASLDTLGVNMAYHLQARTMAQLHAVANARPFVQAARGGLSYIIDQNGRFVDQTKSRGYTVIEGTIQVNSQMTYYTRFGDWPVAVALFMVFLSFTKFSKRTNLKHKRQIITNGKNNKKTKATK